MHIHVHVHVHVHAHVHVHVTAATPHIYRLPPRRLYNMPFIYTKGYLVRRFPYDYMDDAAANTFSYILGKRDGMNWVGLYPSMYHRNSNMMMARWRYRDALTHRWSLLQLVEHDSRRTALRHRSS